MPQKLKAEPDWAKLYDKAAGQGGLFTTPQAAACGYSDQALQKHLKAGRIRRLRHGVYRLVHFPATEHEDLIEFWLWSEQRGVFSHETALMLQNLSDALPGQVHLTLPATWRERRLRVPPGLELHFESISKSDIAWVGHVPVTAPARTISDCVAAHVSPELIQQALDAAKTRGLLGATELGQLRRRAARKVA